MTAKDNWGWKARIGMFIVSNEAVPEAEWWAMIPPGVSVHAARVSAPTPWARWDDRRTTVTLEQDVERGAQHFAGMKLSVAVIGHSSSSIAGGSGWDEAAVARLTTALGTGTIATTNGLDCRTALAASNVKRPFLVFPAWFADGMLQQGVDYFKHAGLAPADRMRVDPGRQWRDLPPRELYPQHMHFEQDVEAVYRQVRSQCPNEADGVLLVGTGLRCVGVLDALEQDLQRPVISANQASLWRGLRLSGVHTPVTGFGSLLRL